jgi:CubicO group peptidase (beta-lactamase class C family)
VAPAHRFQIGSISKGFTAMALLRQAEAGRLDLDAPVSTYLPWFEVQTAYPPITVHHLLTHTSGIVSGTDWTGEGAHEVWSLRQTHAGWAPGERLHYSNAGYKALGLVLEAVTGRRWWETVREEVMAPIDMGDADVIITNAARVRLAVGYTAPFDDRPWQPRHGWAPSAWFESATADGTICATAEELTAFARLLLNEGRGVLSAESFARMTTPFAPDPDAPDHRFGYGVKWVEEEGEPRLLGHSGGMVGFTAYLLVDPEAGFGVTVLMNSAFGDRLALARFALRCLRAQAAGDALPEVPEPADRSAVPEAATFAGTFSDPLGEVVTVAEGERLLLVEDGRRSPLVPLADDRFAVDDPERDGAGVRIRRDGGRAIDLFWGPRSLRAAGAPAVPPAPIGWASLAGRYRSPNPWAPGFDVVLRHDELWLELLDGSAIDEWSHRLTPLDDGSFLLVDPPSPSRVAFDTRIGGRPTRAVLDAAPFFRTAAP